ncbi:MAG: hydrogenase nickel incorporation protein HypB [Verrucomicrobiae bacterium]|nr:hydrogenase nickel incorporation protein HypB [Verrucomicrobiae bacterium]
MCKECGCDGDSSTRIDDVLAKEIRSPLVGSRTHGGSGSSGHEGATHSQEHQHGDEGHHSLGEEHFHEHSHEEIESHLHKTVEINRPILEQNDRIAERNRGFFLAKGIFVINMLSAPGSGKTTLVFETARRLRGRLNIGVIVGDLATQNDAEVLRKASIPVVQVNTGMACHLDAEMVARSLAKLGCDGLDLLIIENVGNLVCPSLFDLGESKRVVLLSTTEGEDKPLKYPPLFHSADVAIITKKDLSQVVGFNRDYALENLKKISHHAIVFEVSAKTGEGMEQWCEYLASECRKNSGKGH